MLELLNENGTVLASSNPLNLLAASLSYRFSSKGYYYLRVSGVGKGTQYTNYGSLGRYSLSGTIQCSAPSSVRVSTPEMRIGPCTCNKGYTGLDDVECMACIAGTYKDVNGSAACTLCPPGKYSTETASVLASTCIDCPAHSYSSAGSESCDIILAVLVLVAVVVAVSLASLLLYRKYTQLKAADGAVQQSHNKESNESSLQKEIAEEDREAEASLCFLVHPCADQAVTFSQQLEEGIRLKVESMQGDLCNGGGEAAEGTIGNMDPVMEDIQIIQVTSGGSHRAPMMAFDSSSDCRLAARSIFFSIAEGMSESTRLALRDALGYAEELKAHRAGAKDGPAGDGDGDGDGGKEANAACHVQTKAPPSLQPAQLVGANDGPAGDGDGDGDGDGAGKMQCGCKRADARRGSAVSEEQATCEHGKSPMAVDAVPRGPVTSKRRHGCGPI